MFMFSPINYHYSDILLKKINFICFAAITLDHTCYCVNKVYVTSASRYLTSASRYHLRYQSRFSMYTWSDSTEIRRIGRGSSDC